ncbi:broad specificity phosphatase PhoE [Streptomyces sp. V3I8]|jgi:probable phosphoglycerate mutase|uniref:histidine phosphatase family protein n=1 Tax=Streptomyces sp. V3I8 TaxID=3042279 RepID=UPI00278071FF|nr:histidine phosphatase family protein [Streptomyces sp. V3I8]MDQ1037174.1 broad specificity phosphatase PhoE [Streptomyces sp. V3I8]
MRLLLIRHGQTPSNVKHLLDTAVPGPALTPLGQRQAAALPDALAGEEIGALYASTLIRTQLTAAPLAERTGLEVRVRDGLRELTAGDLEMRGDANAVTTYMTTTFAWSAGDVELRMPGGENGVEALRRIDAVVAEAAAGGVPTVAMVSHGAAIRMWAAARADNIDVAFAAAHPLDNTGVVILDGTPADGWRVLTWAGRSVGPEDSTPEASGPTGEPVDGGVDGRSGE